MGERIIFSPCNSVFLTAVLCTMKLTSEAPTPTPLPPPPHSPLSKVGKQENGVHMGLLSPSCCFVDWLGSHPLAQQRFPNLQRWRALYPNTSKKASGGGLARGQDPGRRRLRTGSALRASPPSHIAAGEIGTTWTIKFVPGHRKHSC